MVEISLYGSGEGPGWVTAPGYSTSQISSKRMSSHLVKPSCSKKVKGLSIWSFPVPRGGARLAERSFPQGI